ncbi:MAG: tetratricopeptide repeat protein [Bacteroidota bacterium]
MVIINDILYEKDSWRFFILAFTLKGHFLYSQSWKEYGDSVKYFISQKKTDKAIAYYGKVKAHIPPDSAYTDTYIQLSKNIVLLYYSNRQYDEAVRLGNELRPVIEKTYSETNRDYAWVCNLLGAIYNINGKLDAALAVHLKAKEIREKLAGSKSPEYAQSCNNIGALYRDLGQYDLAEPVLLEAKEIREKLPAEKQNDPFAITCLYKPWKLYKDMGQYVRSESFYLQAKERRAFAGKDNRDYASSCNILADLYAEMAVIRKQNHYTSKQKIYGKSLTAADMSMGKVVITSPACTAIWRI